MFLGEDKEETKKKILSAYYFAKPDTKFSRLVDKLGIDIGIILVDEFCGQVLTIPTRASLQRGALPRIIRDELEGLKPKSNEFDLRIKSLSKFFSLRKKAIIKMYESGKYSR